MLINLSTLPWAAIGAAALAGQITSALWFVVLFAKPWAKEYGVASPKEHTQAIPPYTYGIGLLCVIAVTLTVRRFTTSVRHRRLGWRPRACLRACPRRLHRHDRPRSGILETLARGSHRRWKPSRDPVCGLTRPSTSRLTSPGRQRPRPSADAKHRSGNNGHRGFHIPDSPSAPAAQRRCKASKR